MASVKWLERITVLTEPHAGYMQTSYVIQQHQDDPGTLVDRIAPRSLMVRPEMVDEDGVWVVASRELSLRGRAWSGRGLIEGVEVSLDGGETWRDADLAADLAARWVAWRLKAVLPRTGRFELSSRATDAAGNTQPDAEVWNVGGFANNAIERVPVLVVDS
jgi:DMSO/TMAO reductase YedYZ molybdopterin-dependent catalytic subunit